MPGQSGHIHDSALALLHHRRNHLLAAQKRALQVDIHHQVPVLLFDFGKPVRGVQGAAGVVHQQIDVTPEIERMLTLFLMSAFFVTSIFIPVASPAFLLHFGNGGLDGFIVDIGDDDFRPFPGAGMAYRQSHPLSQFGDDRHSDL